MKRRKATSKLIRLGGQLYRLEVVKRPKVTEVQRPAGRKARRVKRRKGKR